MKITSVKLVRDSKSGDFFLVGPGYLKEKVSASLEDSWAKLDKQYQENLSFFQEAGIEDEVGQFKARKIFERSFWIESLVRGLVIMIPLFIGFFLFSYATTRQFAKLSEKINDVIKPYSEKAAKEEHGYKQTLERYRPYVYETLKIIREESRKVEAATEKTK